MEKFWAIFQKKQNTLGSAATVLMTMVLVSRILGLVRDRLLSARFAPDDLGVYFAAFRLPNLIFELLVMGALTAAFIPVFTKYLSQKQESAANKMAATLINLSLLIFLVLALPIIIWAKQISKLLAPGFSPSQIDQMAAFTRFMIGFQVVPLLVGNFFTGILQSYNLFLIPALAPVVYNLGIIISILFFTSSLGLWAPVAGVAVGALLFALIQLPLLLRVGYQHSLSINPSQTGVKEVGRLMGPRTLGLAISQIDTTVDLILASLLGARMVTIFNFAQHLQQLPIGLFGATVAQAALPSLSQLSARQESQEFKNTITRAMNQVLFLVLPMSSLFIVLRIPMVRLVFGASRFDWQATLLTGATLSAFSISLFAQAISQVLTRGFYAIYDSRTPVSVGIISIVVNTLSSIIFIQFLHLPVWSLGLSTSIASLLNAGALLILLDKRVGKFVRYDLIIPPLKMFFASVVTGLSLYIPLKLFDQLVFDTTRTFGLILLTGLTGAIGMSTYLFISWVLGVDQVRSLIVLLKKFSRVKRIIFEPASEVINGGIQDKIS